MTDPGSLHDLTPAQREAVLHLEGPLLVVAGAGSGKTRVITRRVAHALTQGIEPQRVLAITFTNKAAGEMQERIAALTGGARVWVSTFHSFCARTLRRLGPRVGLRSDFTILDEDDQLVAAREAIQECGLDPKMHSPARVLHAIERWKDRLLDPAQAAQDAVGTVEQAHAAVYAAYQATLESSHAVDFGELLVKTVALLRDEGTQAQLAARHHWLLIDEYQDTNHAQYELARLLAAPHRNICATGDPNQSIYGWRGADVRNILEFTRDWSDARVVKLEENFRSTRTILRAANGLVARNPNVADFQLRTQAEEGPPIVMRVLESERDEGRWVAAQVQQELRAGTPPGEVAVFFRMGSLSRALEEALLQRGIPYRVVGAVAFYQRREVKDLLAYLRLAHNPDDELAFQRVVNVPPRGAGRVTLRALRARADDAASSLFAALPGFLGEGSGLRGRARQGLSELLALLEDLRGLAQRGEPPGELLRAILERTHYLSWLKQEFPDEAERAENVAALLAAADEFDRLHPTRPPLGPVVPVAPPPPAEGLPLFARGAPAPTPLSPDQTGEEEPEEEQLHGLAGFLEHAALVAGRDQTPDDHEQRVSLMTVHAAKGLEFLAVLVIGMEDGVFPNSRAMEAPGGLEEERRLAYVALTRARQRLYLSRANWRVWRGQSTPQRPSGFLFEIPAEVFPAGESPSELERRYAGLYEEDDHGVEDERWQRFRRRARGQEPVRPSEGVDPLPWDDEDLLPGQRPDDDDHQAAGGEDERADEDQPAARPRRGAEDARAWARPLAGGPPRGERSAGLPGGPAPAALSPAAIAAAVGRARSEDLTLGELSPGLRVFHEQFGPGVVEQVTGHDPARARVEVRFAGHGKKNLVMQYARLRRDPRQGGSA